MYQCAVEIGASSRHYRLRKPSRWKTTSVKHMTRHISFLLSFLPHRIKRLDLKMPFQLQQFVRHATTTVRVSLLAPGMKLVNKSRLLLINTGSTSAIYLLGDICRQKLEKKEQLDWARCTRMALLGFVNGPFSHFWYVLLDKRITGSVLASILKKVLADQTVMAPLSIVLFYIGKHYTDLTSQRGGL